MEIFGTRATEARSHFCILLSCKWWYSWDGSEKKIELGGGTGIEVGHFARIGDCASRLLSNKDEGWGGASEYPSFPVGLLEHQCRVAVIAEELFQRWARASFFRGWSAWLYRQAVILAALLHDIGKSRMDQALFLTARALTTVDYREVQRHPVLGVEMLGQPRSPAERVVWDGVLHHHQRWDGRGYPVYQNDSRGRRGLGLKGANIPLVARIIAIADVYDALKMERSYKDSWQEGRIRAEFEQQSGRQFDPQLVRLFLGHMGEAGSFFRGSVFSLRRIGSHF